MNPQLVVTEEARNFVQMLKSKHGQLIFHLSGGCCDGSTPMCYQESDFLIGSSDRKLGEIEGCSFYIHVNQYEYWKNSQLIIDISNGRGGVFSLESAEGKRFMLQSNILSHDENRP
ncbi:uncharacterized protein (DUF779 family) [Oikeobacillus pervagus]|uniref:Uncharacterized protein (DUF779 family) n=1 Tax=Oikeobacillus pervagus TaxID=1325931 RepID=A0AAJ1SZ47_9BACI|nr:DUF779 domain-containing protein [Oikeobacillus pervagus]MDQ0214377.1 uncharacterized protein (DUF779 family) [Oikeobacillus pervagus]